MLRTDREGQAWLVTQPHHAEVAGYLAAHWGNRGVRPPRPLRPRPGPGAAAGRGRARHRPARQRLVGVGCRPPARARPTACRSASPRCSGTSGRAWTGGGSACPASRERAPLRRPAHQLPRLLAARAAGRRSARTRPSATRCTRRPRRPSLAGEEADGDPRVPGRARGAAGRAAGPARRGRGLRRRGSNPSSSTRTSACCSCWTGCRCRCAPP